MQVLNMAELDLAGKRVLIREDLNVPVKDGRVTSDARIRAALPTLIAAMDAGARVMVMSHLGRPKEGVAAAEQAEFSLAPVAEHIAELTGRPVRFAADWLDGLEVEHMVIVNRVADTTPGSNAREGFIIGLVVCRLSNDDRLHGALE